MMKEELEKKCYIDKVYSFENFITNESNVEIFELLKWVSSNSDSSTYWSNDKLRKIVEKIKSNDLALLYMEPSVGAEIGILFSDCISTYCSPLLSVMSGASTVISSFQTSPQRSGTRKREKIRSYFSGSMEVIPNR